MKQTLQLRLGQQLTMTPQLQQAIRLLQLSTLELQTEIQEALESNPMLELEEEGNEVAEEDARHNNEEAVKVETAENAAGSEAETAAEADTEFTSSEDTIPDELPVDSAWEDIYEPSYSAGERRSEDSDRDFLDFQSDVSDSSLRDRLLEQLRLLPISEQDHAIGAVIIDAVDDNGYLSESLQDILDGPLANGHSYDEAETLELDQIEAVLHMIQQFDPPGVAARHPGESMSVQLQHLPKNTPAIDIAKTIVAEHLDTLASRDFNRLRRNLKITEEELQTAIALIQSLNPRPGAQIDSKR
ncbi:MAG: RNA polymerase factor sigma-54, partial [Gammaproteobacteria bacterium]|nr:RNA polymerase factor sigma-54 [Gammaproteobacteria bacterium]